MTTQIIVRVDSDLKSEAMRIARIEGKSLSNVVRQLLQEYVQNRDIAAYVDDLWDRIGEEVRAAGYRPQDIPGIIRDVRAKR